MNKQLKHMMVKRNIYIHIPTLSLLIYTYSKPTCIYVPFANIYLYTHTYWLAEMSGGKRCGLFRIYVKGKNNKIKYVMQKRKIKKYMGKNRKFCSKYKIYLQALAELFRFKSK
jgi:hypothetical protein